MKAVVLIVNKDERALIRRGLSDFSGLIMPNQLAEGLDHIHGREPLDLLVLDQRFDSVSQMETDTLSIRDLLHALEQNRQVHTNTLVLCILNESDNPDMQLEYREAGADACIQRPFAVKDVLSTAQELVKWIQDPPAVVRLFRVFRTMLAQGNYQPAAEGLEKAIQVQSNSLMLKLMQAQALLHLDKSSREKGIEKLLALDAKYPSSQSTKTLLVKAFSMGHDYEKAFAQALALFKLRINPDNTLTLLELGRRQLLDKKTRAGFEQILAHYESLETARTKNLRQQALTIFSELMQKSEDIEFFLDKVNAYADIKPNFHPLCLKLLERIPEAEVQLRPKLLRLILDLEPGHPKVLEEFVKIKIRARDTGAAREYLGLAKDAKKISTEYYSSLAKLDLLEGYLKEASDSIQAGKRLAPQDDRWEPLSQEWSIRYRSKEEGTDPNIVLAELERSRAT